MQGDPTELIHANLLTSLGGVTIGGGYDLPQNFNLITREIIDISELMSNQMLLPACMLLMLDTDPTPKCSHIIEAMLHGQVVMFFEANYRLPATEANRFRTAIQRALMADKHRGGPADTTILTNSPPAGLWEGTQLLALVVGFSVLVEYDPRAPALAA